MSGTRWLILSGIWLVACIVVGAIISVRVGSDMPGSWYANLNRPPITPPSWVFGPAWTLLYALMAVSAVLVIRRAGWVAGAVPLSLFALQLGLNLLWSPLFFGLHQPGWALLDLALMWGAILATLLAFRAVSPAAAWLLVPYLCWVSFAGVLNGWFWALNRGG